ncbi:hypothetical protein PybrP1_000401 [[Pythium] brassicae (nom. inval.)]|nr:hypothetical protein PybrP1_000401 [[Pythium] brassicae (nom. inval.)]
MLQDLESLPFPRSLKQVQPFLGSLNYSNKFIEGFPGLGSALYELTDVWIKSGENLNRAKLAFEMLKSSIMSTPVLRHVDWSKPFAVFLHANPWAISVVLGQEFDGNIFPSKALQRRYLQWAALLSPRTMEVVMIEKDEDGLVALLAAGITSQEHLDQVASGLVPYLAGRVKWLLLTLEMSSSDFAGLVVGFDDVTVNEAKYHGLLAGLAYVLGIGTVEVLNVAKIGDQFVIDHRRVLKSAGIRHNERARQVAPRLVVLIGLRQDMLHMCHNDGQGGHQGTTRTFARLNVKSYVERPDQGDGDEVAEKLMWSINALFDWMRKETHFFPVHGWNPKNKMSATMAQVSRGINQRNAYLWRLKTWDTLAKKHKTGFEIGEAVWLYLARVKTGLTKNLAQLWHGPFRIMEKTDEFRAQEPDWLTTRLGEVAGKLDLDAALLP